MKKAANREKGNALSASRLGDESRKGLFANPQVGY